ncbi:MAG: hypothetical protein GXP54_09775, partial [Deltaproteobacteria bacterium]|nr:hypothetical protein [Deltaproteobacteria bacterium]
LAGGRFLVAWSSGCRQCGPTALPSDFQDGDGDGVFARRFESDGTPAGQEFQVNIYTTGSQKLPSAAGTSDDRIVIVWQSGCDVPNGDCKDQDGSGTGVFMRTIVPSGGAGGIRTQVNENQANENQANENQKNEIQKNEIQVNELVTGNQVQPHVTVLSSGRILVVWVGPGQENSGNDIFGRIFESDGVPAGPSFMVNSSTAADQIKPSAAPLVGGRFIVTWMSYGEEDGSKASILARWFKTDGTPDGGDLVVNTYTQWAQESPVVASETQGRFALAWLGGPGAKWVSIRRSVAGGELEPAEFRANVFPEITALRPALGVFKNGWTVAAWTSVSQDGDFAGVFARLFPPP